jgi:class 3 adenylate cyclase
MWPVTRASWGRTGRGRTYAVKAHFGQLVYPKINNHGGRIVKKFGDGLVAEFPSVLGAVRCAVEIQRGMIPIGVSSIATISIFAHWPLALRAEATT